MNLDYYKTFYYVALSKNFTKAAELLGNNQPNVTRSMNNLEAELGCRLFARINRGVSLTPIGEQLFQYVSAAMNNLEQGEEEIKKTLNIENGLVTIGSSETALRLMLLERLGSFHEEHPKIHFRISSYSTPQTIQALKEGKIDFAVISTPVDIKKPLHKTPLMTFQDVLIGGSKYRELASKTRRLNELMSYPFVSLPPETGTRMFYTQYFMNQHLSFHPEIEVAATDQIRLMVRYNLGIGFCPDDLAADYIARGEVCQIHLQEEIPKRQICLVTDESKVLSSAARKLRDALAADASYKPFFCDC